MRAPLCSDTADLCSEEQGCFGSEGESNSEIQTIEKSFERNHSSKTTVFGICLENLMGTTPQVVPQIPFILSRLCRYIEQHGLYYKRLFLEGDEKNLESLKVELIESGNASLESVGNVASAAKLLIIFFEELPEPLIPLPIQKSFIEDMENLSLNSLDHVSHLKQNVDKLSDVSYNVLKYLSRFLLHVSTHKEFNGMSSDNLGLVFGPVIFRLSTNDPTSHLSVQNIVNHFVKDYFAIFEGESKGDHQDLKKTVALTFKSRTRRQLPCPSSVMPVMSLTPLSVEIPTTDSNMSGTEVKTNVPVLLIENKEDSLDDIKENKVLTPEIIHPKVTRKRKERRLSGEDLQQRSSSEERPPATSLTLSKIDLVRRCNSHEEMVDVLKLADTELNALPSPKMIEARNSYSISIELENEKNHSPHPPNAKRREIEPDVDEQDLDLSNVKTWRTSHHLKISDESSIFSDAEKFECNSKQNSLTELEDKTSECLNRKGFANNSEEEKKDFSESMVAKIPRSASCPVPGHIADVEGSSDESNSLSMSWSMLFETEDTEPIRSEHRFSWPLTKDEQEENAILSPSVQSLRKANYYEAPLSPSAYRSYLSYRSTHLDSSVPPSPPVEQEDFAKIVLEGNDVHDSIKQLTKKMHSIKKRIRKFDEKFEMEFGYKPSHAEKANNPEAKKLMSDLYKARKELKALKEESHLEHVSPANWHAGRVPHILEDATNHVQDVCKSKSSIEEAFGSTLKNLSVGRLLAKRPELVEDMTSDQVKDEKVAIQKALLEFESIHGKPSSKTERNTMRPLYDRYRSVKKLLVRSGSFPGSVSKNKDLCSELQPILEHEAMDFSSPPNRNNLDSQEESVVKHENVEKEKEVSKTAKDLILNDDFKSKSSNFLAVKYDNSNIHELPLSEMIFQLQQVKSEKRHLRKILKEFESEFFRLNGRKVQKEDKEPVETLYNEYKFVKAKLKLLDALITKHDQHQLM